MEGILPPRCMWCDGFNHSHREYDELTVHYEVIECYVNNEIYDFRVRAYLIDRSCRFVFVGFGFLYEYDL